MMIKTTLNLFDLEGRITPSSPTNTTNESSTGQTSSILGNQTTVAFGTVQYSQGEKIKVYYKACDGTIYNEIFTCSQNMTPRQVAEMIAADMKRSGWDVEVLSDGSLAVYGHRDGNGQLSNVKVYAVKVEGRLATAQPTNGGNSSATFSNTPPAIANQGQS